MSEFSVSVIRVYQIITVLLYSRGQTDRAESSRGKSIAINKGIASKEET